MTDNGRFQEMSTRWTDKKRQESLLSIDLTFAVPKADAPVVPHKNINKKKGKKSHKPSHKTSQILIQRSKIFYAKPQRNKASKIRWGLPKEREFYLRSLKLLPLRFTKDLGQIFSIGSYIFIRLKKKI